MAQENGSRLLNLPPELRDQIYSQVLQRKRRGDHGNRSYGWDLTIFRTCKQVHQEASRRFHLDNTFVSIETPWEDAPHWVQSQGQIPIVATRAVAARWGKTRLRSIIDASSLQETGENLNFIILLEDLDNFCKHWFYQELNSRERIERGMNSHFDLTMILENIDIPSESLPIWKQRALLEPFCRIKDLNKIEIQGANPDVAEAIKRRMAIPIDTPTQCLEKAIKYKDEGNVELRAGKPQAALDLYLKAFHTMHIVIQGRQRDVHAELFFHSILSKRLDGENSGRIVYYRMRVRLVANVMMAYIKMEQYEECHFWGMRSITLMREMAGALADTPNDGMPGAAEWGKVYYRTGLSAEKLGDTSQAREMFRIAHGWLPHDNNVTEAVVRTALKL